MEIADEDQLDWDVNRDGRMREHATGPEDEPTTEVYLPPIEED